MKIHRPAPWLGFALLLSIAGGPALGFQVEQLSGVVSSVNLDKKKMAVMPTNKEKPVNVAVNDRTLIQTVGGKTLALKDLKAGDGVGISHTAGLASKVTVNPKPDELNGHIKSVSADLKSFVVTETGTNTDVNVAVTSGTSIVTTAGKKIELKELKKGDGVGISHTNSVASKIVVNVKPVE